MPARDNLNYRGGIDFGLNISSSNLESVAAGGDITFGAVYPAQCVLVAQWIERLASDQEVVGSSPTGHALCRRPNISGSNPDEGARIHPRIAQLVEQLPLKETVGGSNPSARTKKTSSSPDQVFLSSIISYFSRKNI